MRLALGLVFKRSTVRVSSDGIWLFCGTSRGAGIWCALTGLEYENELPTLLRFLRPGQVFVDIGANIGAYTIRAARKVAPSGHVFAFEPVLANRRRLEAGLVANGIANVHVVPAAVGDANCAVIIHDGGRESSASLTHQTGNSCEVPMVTLDSFVRDHALPCVDWIKMDIEGCEPMALDGMRDVISRFRPCFLFENHEGGPESCRILLSHGYSIGYYIMNGAWTEGTDRENLFALPLSKR